MEQIQDVSVPPLLPPVRNVESIELQMPAPMKSKRRAEDSAEDLSGSKRSKATPLAVDRFGTFLPRSCPALFSCCGACSVSNRSDESPEHDIYLPLGLLSLLPGTDRYPWTHQAMNTHFPCS